MTLTFFIIIPWEARQKFAKLHKLFDIYKKKVQNFCFGLSFAKSDGYSAAGSSAGASSPLASASAAAASLAAS